MARDLDSGGDAVIGVLQLLALALGYAVLILAGLWLVAAVADAISAEWRHWREDRPAAKWEYQKVAQLRALIQGKR